MHGWVNLDIALMVCSLCPRLLVSGFHKHSCLGVCTIVGHVTARPMMKFVILLNEQYLVSLRIKFISHCINLFASCCILAKLRGSYILYENILSSLSLFMITKDECLLLWLCYSVDKCTEQRVIISMVCSRC